MKFVFALPALALAFVTATAVAQTSTGTGASTGVDATGAGQAFGTNWSLSVGTTFFTDGENRTLRSREEIASGWQSLSKEDRDMIAADCLVFQGAHGGAADMSAPETPDIGNNATATTATDAETSAPTGYDMVAMQIICDAVDTL